MDRDQVDRWCERGILGFLLAILIYGPLATGAVRAQDFLVLQWLTLLMVLVWMVRLGIQVNRQVYGSPLCWLVLAFLLYVWGRYETAEIEYVARQECLRILVYTLIFFALVQNIRRPEHWRLIGLVVVGVGLFVALYGVVQYLTGSDKVWHFQRPAIYALRGSGTYINPNHMAGYLEMILPMALICTVGGRFSILTRILLGYASLVVFLGILVSFSRGGWLACAAGMLPPFLWFLGKRGYRLRGGAMLAAVLAIGLIFAAKAKVSPNRYGEMNAAQQGENIRLLLWKPAWEMFIDHFWWGVGPNHFDDRFREYRPEHRDLQVRPDRVHNDYLNALTDWGMVGGILIFSILGMLAWRVAMLWRSRFLKPADPAAQDAGNATIVQGAVLGLAALLVHSFFDFNMHVPANAILATVLVAIVMSHGHVREGTSVWEPRRVGYWCWIGGLAVGLIVLGCQTWRKTRAVKAILEANSYLPCSDNQLTKLKSAFEIESGDPEIAYRIGECLRLRSWESRPGYEELAREAITWFDLGGRLNPYDPYPPLKKGMCLDWLDEHMAAEAWYEQALALDPNGYYVNALLGWHYLQARDYEKAQHWLRRSLRLFPSTKNFVASYYLGRVNELMAEKNDQN